MNQNQYKGNLIVIIKQTDSKIKCKKTEEIQKLLKLGRYAEQLQTKKTREQRLTELEHIRYDHKYGLEDEQKPLTQEEIDKLIMKAVQPIIEEVYLTNFPKGKRNHQRAQKTVNARYEALYQIKKDPDTCPTYFPYPEMWKLIRYIRGTFREYDLKDMWHTELNKRGFNVLNVIHVSNGKRFERPLILGTIDPNEVAKKLKKHPLAIKRWLRFLIKTGGLFRMARIKNHASIYAAGVWYFNPETGLWSPKWFISGSEKPFVEALKQVRIEK